MLLFIKKIYGKTLTWILRANIFWYGVLFLLRKYFWYRNLFFYVTLDRISSATLQKNQVQVQKSRTLMVLLDLSSLKHIVYACTEARATVDQSISCPLREISLPGCFDLPKWTRQLASTDTRRKTPLQNDTVRIFIIPLKCLFTCSNNEKFNWWRLLFQKVMWKWSLTFLFLSFWGKYGSII